ncbi:ISL3 family transposase [Cellulomonas sp. ATA003]|uniref:ISL3 family transposase n=1 Tax=Cellulomonas sp. ATA003 TaxID=3073064 RepID=UPI002873D902|nr:ISL3 family transposase [Cellulomonas sp. ATA003]WNB86977.1 ISL3 family transposase [Cellulomonas sp. ATA003]
MSDCRSGPSALWCARADALFNVPGLHVLEVDHDDGRVVVTVESDQTLTGCPSCGVVAVAHGRRLHRVHDAPVFATSVLLVWRKRIWRCPDDGCPVRTFSERHDLIAPRAKLTTRAITWATDALTHDDTTVSALARHLGVDWHTCWDAIEAEAARRVADPSRLAGVVTLGVDEHIWKPSHHGAARAVTAMVDLTRDQHGHVHARLLDVVPGRSGTAYATWLKAAPDGFTATVEHAALDPFRGYANAIRDELPDAVAVLDAFHVVKLGTQVVDEVRRRTQQATLGHRGHKDDPLYRIRGLLRHGIEHLTPRQAARLDAGLEAGDPDWAVTVAWGCYQQLRAAYHAPTAAVGRRRAERVIDTFHTCPIPEVARLGRTLRAWRAQVLAYFDTDGVSNGGTEAINLLIEKTRRLAHGFRTFSHYRLRILLAASGTRRRRPHHA